MSELVLPIVKRIEPDNLDKLMEFSKEVDKSSKNKKIIKDYPTVYIHNWKNKDKYEVYVGETNNIIRRTLEHYEKKTYRGKWQNNLLKDDASLYVIAHPKFNKSLTLDIENKLMHYLSGTDNVKKICNGRGNPQNEYYPVEEFDSIFKSIWKELNKLNPTLFLPQNKVMDSALFKASPLHKLKGKQLRYKEEILLKIEEILLSKQQNQLLLIEGSAGTGKTVLMSSIYYDLCNRFLMEEEEDSSVSRDLDCAIVVNHNEQLKVYNGIIEKLSLSNNNEKKVFKATTLLNQFISRDGYPIKRDKLYDVIFVDEAHLLLTRYNQSFDSKHFETSNQLYELMKCAKVVIAMLDPFQVLNTEQYIAEDVIEGYRNLSSMKSIVLDEQLRMQCNKSIQNWIYDFAFNDKIKPLTRHRGDYEIKVFDSVNQLENAIKSKSNSKNTFLSRIVATYDWDYNGNNPPEDKEHWSVDIPRDNPKWSKPWNYELIGKKDDSISWAENPITVNEVGSIYTIQGFDLNYVGVIIGPSTFFKDGKVQHDASESRNDRAIRRRTLADGTKESFADRFLRHELGVLLTRGVNGLYIYACDDALREELKKNI
ncbi:MAG: DUF2075 domain-containing protein [Bacilli bacterium]|nr:DUF2075 domain-containing protein [Bacilli bacterium]